jgi:hypothetical protein
VGTKWGKLNALFTAGTDTKYLNELKTKREVMTGNSKNVLFKHLQRKV